MSKSFIKIRISGAILLIVALVFFYMISKSDGLIVLALIFYLPAAILYTLIGLNLIFLKLKMRVALTILALAGILYSLFILGVSLDGFLHHSPGYKSIFVFWPGFLLLISHLFILYAFYLSDEKIYFKT